MVLRRSVDARQRRRAHPRSAVVTQLELRVPLPVIRSMAHRSNPSPPAVMSPLTPGPVRKGLLLALAISVLVHVAWTFWPVDTMVAPDETVLTATLTEMPPPPVPEVAPVLPQPSVAPKRPTPRPHVQTLTKPAVNEPAIETPPTIADTLPATEREASPSATTMTEANAA